MITRPPRDTATWLLECLDRAGVTVRQGARILDYGCGAGSLVYRLRELGFDAYGFDIHRYVDLRHPDDARYFSFLDKDSVTPGDMRLAAEKLHIPFPDGTFDLVVSTSVLEHVIECAPVFSETARVLKPSGVALHAYPGRASPIEPHMYVPLATVLQARWWFYLWALLGVRNEFQHGLSASETVAANTRYSRIGISYPPRRAMLQICRRYFNEAEIANRHCYRALSGFVQPLRAAYYMLCYRHSLFKAISMAQRLNLLLCSRPARG